MIIVFVAIVDIWYTIDGFDITEVFILAFGIVVVVLWICLISKLHDKMTRGIISGIIKRKIRKNAGLFRLGDYRLNLKESVIEETSPSAYVEFKYDLIQKIAQGFDSVYIYIPVPWRLSLYRTGHFPIVCKGKRF